MHLNCFEIITSVQDDAGVNMQEDLEDLLVDLTVDQKLTGCHSDDDVFTLESFPQGTADHNTLLPSDSTVRQSVSISSSTETFPPDLTIVLLETEICSKCIRQPTTVHPFSIFTIASTGLVSRHFGVSLKGDYVNLCVSCINYCGPGNPEWRYAWPSVLFTLFTKGCFFCFKRLVCYAQ